MPQRPEHYLQYMREHAAEFITVRQSIAPMLALGAAVPIGTGYRAGLEAIIASGGYHAEENGGETDLGTVRTGSLMLGLDGQDTSVFERTLAFLRKNKVSLVKFFTPAPYPGTEFHDRMRQAGRVLDDDWSSYDYGSLLVEPTGMSAAELRQGFDEAYRGFYSLGSIARRMMPPPPRNCATFCARLPVISSTLPLASPWRSFRKATTASPDCLPAR